MARAGVLVNLVMWAFNLFPLPPLDGGRILVGLLPWRQAQLVARIEPWGFFIVMAWSSAASSAPCGCAR
jgi:Zn-dependent protease